MSFANCWDFKINATIISDGTTSIIAFCDAAKNEFCKDVVRYIIAQIMTPCRHIAKNFFKNLNPGELITPP